MSLIRTAALVLPFIFFSGAGWSACTVTQDDGGTYTDRTVPSCASYYPTDHDCVIAPRNNTNGCKRMDMFFAVDWDHADMINNTHRGVWGLEMADDVATDTRQSNLPTGLTGDAENSVGGVKNAANAGWRTLEYDIFLTRDDADPDGDKTVTMGHYIDLMNFGNYGIQRIAAQGKAGNDDGFLMGTSWSDIVHGRPPNQTRVILRDREGYTSRDSDAATAEYVSNNTFINLDEFFDLFTDDKADMVIVMDPKFTKELRQIRLREDGKAANHCIGFCGGYPSEEVKREALALLEQAVSTAADRGMLHRLIFKLPQAVYPSIQDLKNSLGSNFDKTLFAPQPDSTGTKKLANVLAYIENWIYEGGGKHVAFWDTTVPSYTKSQGKPFTRRGLSYQDLTDFLKRRSGKRSAIWIQDLSGPGGRHGNYYMTYTNYPGEVNDVRGDLYSNLYLKYSKNAVITTDRPDAFLQVKAYLKGLFPAAIIPPGS